jgi:hypothetical protein
LSRPPQASGASSIGSRRSTVRLMTDPDDNTTTIR